MFKVRDIMVKAAICVPPDLPIYDAIRLLVNRNITGLPVVDAQLRLLGILSEKDVLSLLYDTEDRADQTVRDYMSAEVVSFDVNDTLIDVCDCLVSHSFRRVPVTCQGRLAGIVSRRDVIHAILKLKHQQLPELSFAS
ncbi:MAG: CBS domain-containing protein [Sedimentisphaerales bacterium]|nr:CBS domain-containing protein [Sedimentisphaerales bacterium]